MNISIISKLKIFLLKFPTELIASHDNDVELSYVHQFLADEDIPNLPTGGGLAAGGVARLHFCVDPVFLETPE